MKEAGSVSCLIPVFNGERYLDEAIRSALEQTIPVAEIIVVDDGSTDATQTRARAFGNDVLYVWQENQGSAAARNHAARIASGEYLAFLDADDVWEKSKISRQLESFRRRPRLGVSLTFMQNFWMPEVASEIADHSNDALTVPQPGSASTAMLRAAAFNEVGPLDESLRHRDLQDWILRAQSRGWESETLGDVLVQRRIHDRNLSRNRSGRGEEELLELASARIAQMRAIRQKR